MPLGPDNPQWRALRSELDALCLRTKAHNAFIVDAWLNLWCASPTMVWDSQSQGLQVPEAILGSDSKKLEQGRRIDRSLVGPAEGHGYARSFAGIYLLLVRSAGPVDLDHWRAAIASALPSIERLTLALPPPLGPGAGSAEGFGAA